MLIVHSKPIPNGSSSEMKITSQFKRSVFSCHDEYTSGLVTASRHLLLKQDVQIGFLMLISLLAQLFERPFVSWGGGGGGGV